MIYYVEDDDNIREVVVYTLKHSGFESKGFSSGKDFISICENEIPELILLDIMLPEIDGLTILKQIKSSTLLKNIPVIMVTAKTGELNTVIGLDSGADDYIQKPFSMLELVSRIKAVLRRTKDIEQKNFTKEFGKFFIDENKHLVQFENKDIDLTNKEFELLLYLVRNEDIVITRERLLEKVWGYSFSGDTRTIDVHVKSLRQKLMGAEEFIQTIRGVGYKFSYK